MSTPSDIAYWSCAERPGSGVVAGAFHPLAIVVLVILLLHRPPGDAVRPALVVVIFVPRAVIRLFVDILGVGRQIVRDAVGKLFLRRIWHAVCAPFGIFRARRPDRR